MKRYVYSNSKYAVAKYFNIEVVFELPDVIYELLHPSDANESESNVVASIKDGFSVPDGALLSAEKDYIENSQQLADYHAFVEQIENMIVQYYHLHLYYTNNSEYNSYYYGILAKNDDGTLMLNFDLSLRISNHRAHRSPDSQKHKKERQTELQKITRKSENINLSIIVNNQQFDTYDDAYECIKQDVGNAVKKMKRARKNTKRSRFEEG